ncbi:uncharacterized protein PG986_000105 [Apiospora aurea]|uniref:Uncharacterized protein n=1 Tax=Apiospora aurea TaxID=335848 RepID=A0ABR1QT61_9PEZI
MAEEPHRDPGPGQPASRPQDDIDIDNDPRLRPDSPDIVTFLYSNEVSENGGESSPSESLDAPFLPASVPGAAGPAFSADTSDPSVSWCRPYRKKKGVLCYADKRLESPDTLKQHIRHWATTPPPPAPGDYGLAYKGGYAMGTANRIWWHDTHMSEKCIRQRKKKHQNGVNPHPSTLMEWCRRFCADESHLKRASIRFEMTDFNKTLVRQKITTLMRELLYKGRVNVEVLPEECNNQLNVYNDTHINRGRMRGLDKFLVGTTGRWVSSLPHARSATNYFGQVVVRWPFSRMVANGRDREYVSVSEEKFFEDWAPAIRETALHRRLITLTKADMLSYHQMPPSAGRLAGWGGIDDY